ncbi:MAG: ATP-binding protein [Alphaproteobacteria bacterium]|jgi:serine/threonine-protein kinase RsbW|nr:ATP-binding protein [Alphaproteobacteria bacterium]
MKPAAGALHLALALDLPALSAAQRQLGDFLAAGGCPPDVCFRVELVVEEAMMNVIRHAEPMGATRAALDAHCVDGRALVAVEDDGPEFNPLQAAQRPIAGAIAGAHEGGFGLHLIRGNSDAARYARTQAGTNRLEMEFTTRPRKGGTDPSI